MVKYIENCALFTSEIILQAVGMVMGYRVFLLFDNEKNVIHVLANASIRR